MALSVQSRETCARLAVQVNAQIDSRLSHWGNALRFSGNPTSRRSANVRIHRATTGRLMLASSTDHATAIPHSARISRCVIPRKNRPHMPRVAPLAIRTCRESHSRHDSRLITSTINRGRSVKHQLKQDIGRWWCVYR